MSNCNRAKLIIKIKLTNGERMINNGNFNEVAYSGSLSVTTDATSVKSLGSTGSGKINGVCFLQVTGANPVILMADGASDGILLPADSSILPVYIDDLDKIFLKGSGGASTVKFMAY